MNSQREDLEVGNSEDESSKLVSTSSDNALNFCSETKIRALCGDKCHIKLMAIDCLVLGAGQEVGKSCVVVTINGKRIMFDCGMHMGYSDYRRYPDFSLITKSGDFNNALSCIVITHFHLDHIGALPYFTEVCGYNGPIYMTYPTKALAPLMLDDYRKVMVGRGEEQQFTSENIINCLKKGTNPSFLSFFSENNKSYCSGYQANCVLGAAMFYASVGDAAMVYTEDYNMTPDRHLGAAQIDLLHLNLLITESTYGKTIRDSKYAREREFLNAICLTIQANLYYKVLISWARQKVKDTYATRNTLNFKNVQSFERSLIHAPRPCVLFPTPGMLSGGFSLIVFKHWAPCESNLITLPGYRVAGIVGHKLSDKTTKVDVDKDTQIDVHCKIHRLSFSPHTDEKGIMDLVKFLSLKNVILVYGEIKNMDHLKGRIRSELGIKCYYTSNNETVSFPTTHFVKGNTSSTFIHSSLTPNFKFVKNEVTEMKSVQVCDERVTQGILMMEKGQKVKIVHQDEPLTMVGTKRTEVEFAYCFPLNLCSLKVPVADENSLISALNTKISNEAAEIVAQDGMGVIQVNSFRVAVCKNDNCPYRINSDGSVASSDCMFLCCNWLIMDKNLAWRIISVMKSIDSSVGSVSA